MAPSPVPATVKHRQKRPRSGPVGGTGAGTLLGLSSLFGLLIGAIIALQTREGPPLQQVTLGSPRAALLTQVPVPGRSSWDRMPAEVKVQVLSSPGGALVRFAGGHAREGGAAELQTPVTLVLPRSPVPVLLRLGRSGYLDEEL